MKKLFSILLSASLLFGAVSCEKEPVIDVIPEVKAGGFYILNSGSFGNNNSSVKYYNPETNEYINDYFTAINGKQLGDTANDILAYGSKIYITAYGSGVLYVTDALGAIVKEIKLTDYTSPRCLTAANGNVYVSYYDGAVAQLDTASFSVKTASCGLNPEELKVANDKLYVSVSEGMSWPDYGKTVGIYDASTMDPIKTIEIGLNPSPMEVNSKESVYVICNGDYGMVTPSLKVINSSTDEVSDVKLEVTVKGETVELTPSWMSMGANDKLYLICAKVGDSWDAPKKIYTYDTVAGELEGEFIADGTEIPKLYYITADAKSGDVFIGSSDYNTTGDIYIYSANGVRKTSIDAGGINPIAVTAVPLK